MGNRSSIDGISAFLQRDRSDNVARVNGTGVVATTDGAIKASPGVLHGVLVSFDGATAGDKIEFQNSATTGGTALVTIVAQAADENVPFMPVMPVKFDTGIYMDKTLTGGAVTASIVYS